MSLVKEAKIHENLDFLQRFVGPDNNPKFFFTMTEINKVGINPRSTYDTPLGVYCYPLISEFFEKLKNQGLPFAGTKPYVNLFTLNVPTFNMTTYNEAQLKKDTEHLKLLFNIQEEAAKIDPILEQKFRAAQRAYEEEGTMSYSEYNKIANEYYRAQDALEYKHSKQTIDKAFREAKGSGHPIGKFWNLTRILSGNAKAWNHLLRRLGYTNFYDPGTGMIHSNEPTQAVIVDPSVIIVVETFFNPHSSINAYDYPHVPKHEKDMMVQRQKQVSNLAYRLENLDNPVMLDKIAHSHINNVQVLGSIVRNQKTPPETLSYIYDNVKNPSELLYSFTGNPNTTSDVLTKIFNANPSYKEQVVRHQNAPLDLLQQMVDSEDSDDRYTAAQSRRLTPDMMRKLIRDESDGVRQTAIGMSTPEVLHELAMDENTNPRTRVAIIHSSNISPETLKLLSKDKDPSIRQAVAYDYRTPLEVVLELAHDPSPQVRSTLAQSSHISGDVLEILAKDPVESIVRSVASNYNTPLKVLKQLAHHPSDDVRYYVIRNENRDTDLARMMAEDTSPKVLDQLVYSFSELPPDIIRTLAKNPHSTRRVFSTIAQNDETPSDVLLQLLGKQEAREDSAILSHIVGNSNVTPEIITMLWDSPDSELLRSSIARSPKTPPEILRKIIDNYSSDRYTMEGMTANDNITPELLDLLSRSEIPRIRSLVARRPRTSWETLQRLLKDPNYDTAYYAQRNLEDHPEKEEKAQAFRQKLFQKGPIMANNSMNNIQKTGKKDSEEKIPLSEVKKMPYKSLNRMIKKMKQYLKTNEVVQKMFKDYDVDISEIDYIPMMFGNLDVSAKTDHGVIILNYKLLTDGDFFKDFSYGVHEMTHWLQQTTGQKATQSSDDGSYLDNPYEQEGFQNQVEYIAEQFGEPEAEQYVDDLLKHHEIDDKKEHEEKKETLMSKV